MQTCASGSITGSQSQATSPDITVDNEHQNKGYKISVMGNNVFTGSPNVTSSVAPSVAPSAMSFATSNASVAASIVTFITKQSGVSTVKPAFLINDPLVVVIGIGEYDENSGYETLDGVSKDYYHIIHTFVHCWRYKVLFKSSKNKTIYTNTPTAVKSFEKRDDNDDGYKLHWTKEEILQFGQESCNKLVEYQHNGLLFVISCHGGSQGVIYDSTGEEFVLEFLCEIFRPIPDASDDPTFNHLYAIPKIFFLDICRGSMQMKVYPVKKQGKKVVSLISNNSTDEDFPLAMKGGSGPILNGYESHNTGNNDNKNEQSDDQQTQEHPKNEEKSEKQSEESNSEQKQEEKQEEKDEEEVSARHINFYKIYANIDGYKVADGSVNGGLFLRNVSKVFRDTPWVQDHEFTDILNKIRQYTSSEATLYNNLFNFTQIVETGNTLQNKILFETHRENVQVIANINSHSGSGIRLNDITRKLNEFQQQLQQLASQVNDKKKSENNNNNNNSNNNSNNSNDNNNDEKNEAQSDINQGDHVNVSNENNNTFYSSIDTTSVRSRRDSVSSDNVNKSNLKSKAVDKDSDVDKKESKENIKNNNLMTRIGNERGNINQIRTDHGTAVNINAIQPMQRAPSLHSSVGTEGTGNTFLLYISSEARKIVEWLRKILEPRKDTADEYFRKLEKHGLTEDTKLMLFLTENKLIQCEIVNDNDREQIMDNLPKFAPLSIEEFENNDNDGKEEILDGTWLLFVYMFLFVLLTMFSIMCIPCTYKYRYVRC